MTTIGLPPEIHRQWEESRVLRLGAWTVAIIVAVYLLLWLDDTLTLLQAEWRQQERNNAGMAQMEPAGYWQRRREQASEQLGLLEAHAWQGETEGLQKAAIQQFMNQAVSESGSPIRLLALEFSSPVAFTETFQRMRGRVVASVGETTMPWGWLAAIESHQPGLVIDRLEVRVRRTDISISFEFSVLTRGRGAS